MFHFCTLAKALSDANRVRILMALTQKPLCVCQVTELLKLAPSTTSKHLSILRQSQLIECVKNGRWAYYQLPTTPANNSIALALRWVQESIATSQTVLDDRQRVDTLPCLEEHQHIPKHLKKEHSNFK